jgi:hypothetical protein
MSGMGATKVLSHIQSFHGREDELLHLLSLVEALRAHRPQEGEERAQFSGEERAVLGVLRDRLSHHAGEARRRLERVLLKVELLRRRLVERTSEPAGGPAASAEGPNRELMIQRLQASYLAKARTTYQAARQAALQASKTELTPSAQDEENERVRGLVSQAAAMALAGYLADVKSSQPSRVLIALRNEVTTQVKTVLRIENALRTVDGLKPTAAETGTPPEPRDETAPAQEAPAGNTPAQEAPAGDTPAQEAPAGEAREEEPARPRKKTAVKRGRRVAK